MNINIQVAEFAALNSFDYKVDPVFIKNEPVVIGYKISLSRGSAIASKEIASSDYYICQSVVVDRALREMHKAFIKAGL